MTEKGVVVSRRTAASSGFARVYSAMGEVDAKVDKFVQDFHAHKEQSTRDADLQKMVTQRIETKLDALIQTIGSEQEDGKGGFTGVGLVGRVRRVEDSQDRLQSKYRSSMAYSAGFCTALMGAVTVIWWLVSDKIEIALKGTGNG